MLDTQKTFEEQQIQEGKVLKVMSKGQALAIAIAGKSKKANSDRRAAQKAKEQEVAKKFQQRRRWLGRTGSSWARKRGPQQATTLTHRGERLWTQPLPWWAACSPQAARQLP